MTLSGIFDIINNVFIIKIQLLENKYSGTLGAEKADELLALVDVLMENGYDVSEPLRDREL